jgi:hypothetical protein
MQKDAKYHEAAIKYNEQLADAADAVADELEHEVIEGWARSVAKQHRFHLRRHQKALTKLQDRGKHAAETDDRPDEQPPVKDDEKLTPEEIARLDAQTEEHQEREVDRSSVTGQFVSEEYAEKHPDITVHETMEDDGLLRSPEGEILDPQEPTVVPAEEQPQQELSFEEAQQKFAEAQARAEANQQKED